MKNDVIVLFESIPVKICDDDLDRIRRIAGGKLSIFDTEDELLESSEDAEILLTWGGANPIRFCQRSKKLRWIYVFSAGMEGVLVPEIENLPIKISNCKGVHGIQMSETVLAYILVMSRRMDFAIKNQANSHWTRFGDADEAFGKTVLVLGSGAIGLEVSKRCKALGMRVIGAGVRDVERPYTDVSITMDRLDEYLPEADFVVCLVPAAPETKGLIGKSFLSKMKKTARLINISRGSLVDTDALIAALEKGVIAGAALDVTDPEPLPDESPLWRMPNVIITPHIGGNSPRYMERVLDIFAESIEKFRNGEEVPNRAGGKG
jgi:phosphoglycerate dehydrogenase-like enzyme